jgi:hypothetical protein
MPNDENFLVSEFRTLELIWNLACLREAASAKAGAWNLALIPWIPYANFIHLLRSCPYRRKSLLDVRNHSSWKEENHCDQQKPVDDEM